jgi:hypothetical protein
MPALLFLCYQDRTARCAIVLYYFYPGANRGKAPSQARTIRPNLLQGRGSWTRPEAEGVGCWATGLGELAQRFPNP